MVKANIKFIINTSFKIVKLKGFEVLDVLPDHRQFGINIFNASIISICLPLSSDDCVII